MKVSRHIKQHFGRTDRLTHGTSITIFCTVPRRQQFSVSLPDNLHVLLVGDTSARSILPKQTTCSITFSTRCLCCTVRFMKLAVRNLDTSFSLSLGHHPHPLRAASVEFKEICASMSNTTCCGCLDQFGFVREIAKCPGHYRQRDSTVKDESCNNVSVSHR